jgi:NAD(P)-dependent dehydrogenase (short-subunit alcohol dehydrogenase family)
VIGTALERFGSVDILVNGAGINPYYGPIIELGHELAAKTIEANVLSVLAWTQAAYQAWMRDRGGAIVNVASIAGLRAAPQMGIYAVSKAALIQLTQQLALELSPSVRVNAVAPSLIKTRFASKIYEGRESEVAAMYPLQTLGEVEDVAEAVVYLATPVSRWITGQTLVVDGGILLTTNRPNPS